MDVNLLLESMKSSDTMVGGWVNVMGYIGRGDSNLQATTETVRDRRLKVPSKGNQQNLPKSSSAMQDVRVQAVMLWSAGAIKLGEYEQNLEDRKHFENDGKARANR